jgi:hypothetical protein
MILCHYLIIFILFCLIFIPLFFHKILGRIAYNVPAVYDVFASPIKETAGFQGLQKCGWS